MTTRVRLIGVLVLVLILLSRSGGSTLVPSAIDQVTYVYEKDQGSVPRPVSFALQQINAGDTGIQASSFEQDQRDGDGQIPDQYKVALRVGREAGLPCLVVQAGEQVVRIVNDPQTEDDVMGAL